MGLQSLVLILDAVTVSEVVGRELRFFGGGHEALLPAGALCPTLILGLTLVIGCIPRIRSQPACAKQEERANLSLPRSSFGRASGALRFLFSQPEPNLYRLFNREGRASSFLLVALAIILSAAPFSSGRRGCWLASFFNDSNSDHLLSIVPWQISPAHHFDRVRRVHLRQPRNSLL